MLGWKKMCDFSEDLGEMVAVGSAGLEIMCVVICQRSGKGAPLGWAVRSCSYIWGSARLKNNACSFAPKQSGEVGAVKDAWVGSMLAFFSEHIGVTGALGSDGLGENICGYVSIIWRRGVG
jgi:hypothetical protein